MASSNYILLIYFNWILIKVNQWFLILILEHIAYLKHCKVVEKNSISFSFLNKNTFYFAGIDHVDHNVLSSNDILMILFIKVNQWFAILILEVHSTAHFGCLSIWSSSSGLGATIYELMI